MTTPGRSETLEERIRQLDPLRRAALVERLAHQARDRVAPAPRITPTPEHRFEAFPLTDLQEAYWLGRAEAFAGGSIASHCYVELEVFDHDPDEIEAALLRVIDRHDALRTILLPDGRQRVLDLTEPYAIDRSDWSSFDAEELAAAVAAVRDELSHQVMDPEVWPPFDIRVSRMPSGCQHLFVSLDALAFDARSLTVFFEEWDRFLRDPAWAPAPLELTFRDYVLRLESSEREPGHERAKAYWDARLDALPGAPDLPGRASRAGAAPRFIRRSETLEPAVWGRFKERAADRGISPTIGLLTAYADVLSIWSGSRHFTVSVPEQNRPGWHPEIHHLVGQLASFVLLEIDNRGDDGFASRAKRHQARLWEDLEHSRYTGVQVLRDLARRRGAAALMPVVFTSLPPSDDELPALGRPVFAINQSSQVWLDNHVREHEGGLVCDWDTADSGLDPEMTSRMLDHFLAHLEGLSLEAARWDERLSDLAGALVDADDRTGNRTRGTVEPIPEVPAHAAFVARALAAPGSTAVMDPRRTLPYGQLFDESQAWAEVLRAGGSRRDRPIAICTEKGWEQIVAVLAVLQAGAPYLPVDPAQPIARIRLILERAGVRTLLTQPWLVDSLAGACSRTFAIEPGPVPSSAPRSEGSEIGPDDLAYVLFTSGTTGVPKGAMIEHRGLVNALVQTQRAFGIGPADRVLALTALHHDMSVFDTLGVLGAGGTIVLPALAGLRDPAHWVERMSEAGVTLWNSVPAMLQMLVEYAAGRVELPASLRLAFTGGDWIPLGLPDRLRALVPGLRLVSVGGPTETTLWNIWHEVEAVDPEWASIPYGRPIANTCYHLLTDAMDPVPVGVAAEMYVAGVGVARGYIGDEALTRERFVRHPVTGERLFRTGDRGRVREDGTIEILGRVDDQLKIAGHRIEPGEIETALRRHDEVLDTRIVAVGSRPAAELVACVIPRGGRLRPDALREHLEASLPPHMIPRRFVALESFPLTANGKVDRAALSRAIEHEPLEEAGASLRADAEDAGSTIARLREIVSDVLGVEGLSPDTNILDAGADSIDMVRIGNRLEEVFGHRPRIDELFRLQTIQALADVFATRPPLPDPVAADRATPVSPSPEAEHGSRLLADAEPVPDRSDASTPEEQLRTYRLLHTPEERQAFKDSQPGIRRDLFREPGIDLDRDPRPGDWQADYQARRSHRRFSEVPIPRMLFGRFLSSLTQLEMDGKPKYLYASPGGLYPTQTYLHVKSDRVEGIEGGTFYHDPIGHRLVPLSPGATVDRDIHIPFINTPIFDSAAFSIFLVTDLDAIGPAYGDRSLHFAAIEAGIMAHLLETAAPRQAIGLCQIGSIRFESVRPLLRLTARHVLTHSLLGGRLHEPEADGVPGADALAETLERVERLSDEAVEAALRARREADRRRATS